MPRRAAASQEAVDDYAPSQTPWGDPDLQGIWGAGYIFTPLERPDVFEGRAFLTDQEAASLQQLRAQLRQDRDEANEQWRSRLAEQGQEHSELKRAVVMVL